MKLDFSSLVVIDEMPRIADTKVQEALQFGDIQHLHKLIARNEIELATYGGGVQTNCP